MTCMGRNESKVNEFVAELHNTVKSARPLIEGNYCKSPKRGKRIQGYAALMQMEINEYFMFDLLVPLIQRAARFYDRHDTVKNKTTS